jgi:hypothetical protein
MVLKQKERKNPMTAEAPSAPSSRTPKVLLSIGAVLLATAVTGGGLLYAGITRIADAIPTPQDFAAAMAPEPYLDVSPAVVKSVQDMSELTTVEMTEFTIVEKGTDQGWLQWARGDTVRLMAVANIGAGVDLAGLTADSFTVSDTGVVDVSLPNAEILYVAVDNDATQILERDKGLFTKGDPQLESEARRIADTVLTEAALDAGILTKAEENARGALTGLLLGLGYTDVVVNFG